MNSEEHLNNHYVLNNPINSVSEVYASAVFGLGCYWGPEKGFWRIPGVYSTAVGFCGGNTKNPTYHKVCTGKTNHAECVKVFYDPEKLSFVDLLGQFWSFHDPTQRMEGDEAQYRSVIFVNEEAEKILAEASLKAYEKLLGDKIVTEVVYPSPPFYYAEDYHQQYLAKPGNAQYCSASPSGKYLQSFEEWAPPNMEKYKPKLSKEYWDKHGPKPGHSIKGTNQQIIWKM